MIEYLNKVSVVDCVIHTSKKRFRAEILKHGIKPKIGSSYMDNWPAHEWGKIRPAVFAINSSDASKAFGYEYKGEGKLDFWMIDAKQLDITWYIDPNMGGKAIMTFDLIKPKALQLITTI